MFKDRASAGKILAELLKKYSGSDAVVLAIPRGGLPIAHQIAQQLNLALGIALAKKIGHPLHPEYAIGAATAEDFFIADRSGVNENYIQQTVNRIQELLREKELFYGLGGYPDIVGKNIILADDGVATGRTLMSLIRMLRKKNPKKITVAVPVAPRDSILRLQELADEVVCPLVVDDFPGVGYYYEDFHQVSDEEAKEFLRKSS